MSAPVTVIHVTVDDLHAAAAELEATGYVEWADQGGETVRLELLSYNTDDTPTLLEGAAAPVMDEDGMPAFVVSVVTGERGRVTSTDTGTRTFTVEWPTGAPSVESLDDGGQGWTWHDA